MREADTWTNEGRVLDAADALDYAAMRLVGAFEWRRSPQGPDYWAAQHAYLESIARYLRQDYKRLANGK